MGSVLFCGGQWNGQVQHIAVGAGSRTPLAAIGGHATHAARSYDTKSQAITLTGTMWVPRGIEVFAGMREFTFRQRHGYKQEERSRPAERANANAT
jgi:hypothetical protein